MLLTPFHKVYVRMYRVTHQVVANLPLTLKQKFRFGLEVRHKLICHPVFKMKLTLISDLHNFSDHDVPRRL